MNLPLLLPANRPGSPAWGRIDQALVNYVSCKCVGALREEKVRSTDGFTNRIALMKLFKSTVSSLILIFWEFPRLFSWISEY